MQPQLEKETRGSLGGTRERHREQHTPITSRPRRQGRKPRESKRMKDRRLASLETLPVPKLFQDEPKMFTPSFFGWKGYTDCLAGFFRSARQRRATIIRNHKMLGRRFTHLANINLFTPRHPELINRDFRAFVRQLNKRGVRGHWTIQINKKNIVHWHLLFADFRGTKEDLKAIVADGLGGVATFPMHRVHVDRIRHERRKLDYVLEVRKSGHGEVFDPLRETSESRNKRARDAWDVYSNKRVLFVPKTGLQKHGTFGDFWANGWNEKKLWTRICEETAAVERNYKNPRIRRFVDDIHSRLGIPLSRVKWAYCVVPPWHLINTLAKAERSVRPTRTRTHGSPGLVGLLFRQRKARASPRRSPAIPLPIITHSLPRTEQELGLDERACRRTKELGTLATSRLREVCLARNPPHCGGDP
jgi:hypothetical protein